MIPPPLRIALATQLAYTGFVIAWQLIGVALIAGGKPALGPTASLAVAVQSVIIGVLFVLTLRRSPLAFVILSFVVSLAAGGLILNALTADPGLWMSEPVRYLSIALNGVGLLAPVLGVVGYARWMRIRRENRDPGHADHEALPEAVSAGSEE